MTSFTEIVPTAYGKMLCHRYDTNQTMALRKTGIACGSEEIDLLASVLKGKKDPVFFDVGANIGCYTMALQPYCKTIHAVEAQRLIYYMLAGSVVLNGFENVFCHNFAVGEKEGILNAPKFDMHKLLSWGSVEFGDSQKEYIGQERDESTETVPMIPLDRLFAYAKPDVIKLDVEGMEVDVLMGSYCAIQKQQPVMLVEHLKSDKEKLCRLLEGMGYAVEDRGCDYFCTPQKGEEQK